MNVVTYQSSNHATIDICTKCSKDLEHDDAWPKDHRGDEYHSVERGSHVGACEVCCPGSARLGPLFFLTRAEARLHGRVVNMGVRAWGSFGLYPTDAHGYHRNVIRVWRSDAS